jgi:hypothetical protein
MSENFKITSSDGSSIDILPIVPDFTTLLADGLNFVNIDVTFVYLNKSNIDITGILNFQGSNGDLQSESIRLPRSGGGNSQTMTMNFMFSSNSPGQVRYTLTLNSSIGNATTNSVVINYLDVTPQNTKLIVQSGAIVNTRSIPPSSTTSPPGATPVSISTNDSIQKPRQCPSVCPQPLCPQPFCPTPSCPACPACPTANCPVNTNSSLAGATDGQKCEIDYTPIIIIGVLIIILLLILLYLQLTNNK